MKGGDKSRLAVIRLIMAAVKQREVDERIELDDSQVLAVLDKMVKQRRDSIQQYTDAAAPVVGAHDRSRAIRRVLVSQRACVIVCADDNERAVPLFPDNVSHRLVAMGKLLFFDVPSLCAKL